MERNSYWLEVQLKEGDAVTFERLNEYVRSVLTDDEFIFRKCFELRIIFKEGITFEELSRDVQHLQRRGSNSNYYWNIPRAVDGPEHPELHVLLTEENS